MLKLVYGCLCTMTLLISPAFCEEPAVAEQQARATETYEQARQRAHETPGYKNLQKIGLAMHGYHDIFGHFPQAVVYASDGKTPHSWRVELLPVLKHYVNKIDHQKLNASMTRDDYNELIKECGYDVNQPWNSEANAEVLKSMPDIYQHPSQPADATEPAYYVVKGEGTAFDGSKVIGYGDYSEPWVGSTLMVVESRGREPWTKPVDLLYAEGAVLPRFGGFTNEGALGMTCDGAVHFLRDSTPPDDLRALITRDPDDQFTIPGIPYRFKN